MRTRSSHWLKGERTLTDSDLLQSALDANDSFYNAFEQRDMSHMNQIWEHSDHVFCVHPGRAPVHGWMRVAASWYQLFTNQERLHILISEPQVVVRGSVAWVSCTENLIEDAASNRVTATNIFHLDSISKKFRMQAHVGSFIIE